MPTPNGESVQEVSKLRRAAKKAKWPKTDARHWQGRLFKNSFTRDGVKQQTADWCVKIAYKGRRETFNLGTPNAEAASGRALKIYRALAGAGWDAALTEFKPQAAPKAAKAATVGAWLEAVKRTADLRFETFSIYAGSLRQIAAEIEGIGDQPELDESGSPKRDKGGKPVLRSRFDHRTGGRDAWAAKVDAVSLAALNDSAVQQWKIAYVARAGGAPDARKRAENSAASLIRSARALFSEKCRKFAEAEMALPEPRPFANIKLPKRGNTTYQSRIDAGTLIEAAKREVKGEPFKIFVLGLLLGLRKREIDLLLWSQVDFGKGVVRIERTKYFHPKSEDSVGVVDVDPETLELMCTWQKARQEFVVQSPREPRHTKSRVNYRCAPHFKTLYAWLRQQGISAGKPLHELRKELGALLASSQGIFAAQSVLRHAQISTTAAYYADKKTRITAGLGALLNPKPAQTE